MQLGLSSNDILDIQISFKASKGAFKVYILLVTNHQILMSILLAADVELNT